MENVQMKSPFFAGKRQFFSGIVWYGRIFPYMSKDSLCSDIEVMKRRKRTSREIRL